MQTSTKTDRIMHVINSRQHASDNTLLSILDRRHLVSTYSNYYAHSANAVFCNVELSKKNPALIQRSTPQSNKLTDAYRNASTTSVTNVHP